MPIALALVASYLVGSVNFAVIVSRLNGIDIREVGSGNPGTSNVLRSVGKLPAAMVLVGDTLKGAIAAAMGTVAAGLVDPALLDEIPHWAFAAGLAAVLGHCYPVFERFKGGRGVATALGVLLFAVPLVGLIVFLVWVVSTRLTKVASISSLIVAVITIPLAIWLGISGLSILWMAITVLVVVWRHRANIGRMFKGNEQKVTTS